MFENIKHLVFAGGGPTGFSGYGAMKYLLNENHLKMEQIETIYATSIGCAVAFSLCLEYEFSIIEKYLLERPYDAIFPFSMNNLIQLYNEKGLYGTETAYKMFTPLLEGKGLSKDITLEEFYDHFKIDIHFMTFDLNSDKTYDISYTNEPKMKIIDALYATGAIPTIMKPYFLRDMCLIDGGIRCNYPLKRCTENTKCKLDEVIGFENLYPWSEDKPKIKPLTQDSSIIEYASRIVSKLTRKSISEEDNPKIPYEIKIYNRGFTLENLTKFVKSSDYRKSLIVDGVTYTRLFVEYCEKFKNTHKDEIVDDDNESITEEAPSDENDNQRTSNLP
jgi:predicted acylesterase/phospholipase RssA